MNGHEVAALGPEAPPVEQCTDQHTYNCAHLETMCKASVQKPSACESGLGTVMAEW